MQMKPDDTQELLQHGQSAMAQNQWSQGVHYFGLALQRQSNNAAAWHNLGVCLSGLGRWPEVVQACKKALALNPALWQSQLIWGKASKAAGDAMQADACFKKVLQTDARNADARIALADLYMNVFGQPLTSVELVKPLLGSVEYGDDAELTTIMAGLYDRDDSAEIHNQRVMAFSSKTLQLEPARDVAPGFTMASHRSRPRVGLLSPLFCVSPVYFLTIAGWQHVAKACDLVVFNRGHKQDWATQIFHDLAVEWHDVQEIDALQLNQSLIDAQLDVLYDLGGWADPNGLKALSTKPVPKMFKWVGGQSVTTGLHCFDGWIGDPWQSPHSLQHLYTEPLINIDEGYATYTPPSYLPTNQKVKRDVPVVFSNPAKLSRAFLNQLKNMPGKKCLVHQQYQYPQSREKVLKQLPAEDVEFVMPSSHREALEILGQHKVMLDTFPYSSGLTAHEALALGVEVKAQAGRLFCERHTARLV